VPAELTYKGCDVCCCWLAGGSSQGSDALMKVNNTSIQTTLAYNLPITNTSCVPFQPWCTAATTTEAAVLMPTAPILLRATHAPASRASLAMATLARVSGRLQHASAQRCLCMPVGVGQVRHWRHAPGACLQAGWGDIVPTSIMHMCKSSCQHASAGPSCPKGFTANSAGACGELLACE
jgi:hypothetical protein